MNILHYLHFLGAIFFNLYPFIIQKNKYDYFYVYIILLGNLCWLLFNGECFISLILKKLENKNYRLGNNVDSDDIKNILGVNLFNIFKYSNLILNSLSYTYIIYRNYYPKYLYIFLLFSIIYGYIYITFENQNKLNNYILFKIFKYIFIFISIIFIILFSNYLYKNKKF